MRKLLLLIIGIVVIVFGVTTIVTVCGTPPVEKRIYITVTDSTAIDSLIYYREQLKRIQDTLTYVKDSLGEDLFIARYKLGRIKYYTNIVDNNPSQIKFYKGWIKRALKE